MPKKRIFKIIFMNQGKEYEIYAQNVGASGMLGFVEVSELLFGEKTSVVLDPSEESLKNEFRRVRRTYIPMRAIIRIDEVEKQGQAKITEIKGEQRANVMPFPTPPTPDIGNES
jgi:hypothetical protein